MRAKEAGLTLYVSFDRRMIFLAHPRTASRATAKALEPFGFGLADSGFPGADLGGPEHHRPLLKKPSPDWLVFTTVRNTFDAWLSWWLHSGLTYKPLDETYIRWTQRHAHYWPEPDRMWGLHADQADVLLRYESLETDLSALIGETVSLPVVGASSLRCGRTYREVIDPAARAYIERRFGPEMEALGYGW